MISRHSFQTPRLAPQVAAAVLATVAVLTAAADAGPRRPINVENLSVPEICTEYVRQSLRLGFEHECEARLREDGYHAEEFRAYLALDEGMRHEIRQHYAAQGHADAQHALAQDYLRGAATSGRDVGAALDLLREAAEQGHPKAQQQLGLLYLEGGDGVQADAPRALRWLTASAQQGNSVAQRALGRIYRHGWGVSVDGARTIAWLEKASTGDAYAMTELGVLHERGEFVPLDADKAFKYYSQAALSDPEAMYLLGKMHLAGRGTKRNEEKALLWLTQVAAGVHDEALGSQSEPYRASGIRQLIAQARYDVGRMHEIGRGTPRNLEKAAYWYEKAADAELPQAVEALERVKAEGVEALHRIPPQPK